jgi:ribonuclease HI
MLPTFKSNIKTIYTKIYPEVDFRMYFDGCSKGNPGLGGAGAVIYYNNDEIWNGSSFVGTNITNNYAEYSGLIMGLQKAIDMNIKNLSVFGDSELIINHMTGKYKCNSLNLIELYEKSKELEGFFDTIQYTHIVRSLNKRADTLSNIAVTQYVNEKNKENI